MNETGRVEILMATYNGKRFIKEQIDSILCQTNREWKMIISDDGSTDQTQEIIDEYITQYPDKIRQHHSGKRFGNARDHFYYLMSVSEGDYLFFCDQDDVWYPEKIEKLMKAMISAEEREGKAIPILVFGDLVPVDREMRPLGNSLMAYQKQDTERLDYKSLLLQNVVTGGSMVVNRALVSKALKCADPEHIIMHDGWLALVAARFGKIVFLNEPLGCYRQHAQNSVGAKHVGSVSYVIKSLSHPKDIKAAIGRKKEQAQVFRTTYEQELNGEDLEFVKQFEKPRSGILFYWKNRERICSSVRKLGFYLFG